MSPLAHLCPGCGAVIAASAKACDVCARKRESQRGTTTERGLGWQHQRRRGALVRSGERTCYLCGNEGSWTDPDDPLTADHVVPRAKGGHGSEYRPAHRSCNSRRGSRFFTSTAPDPSLAAPRISDASSDSPTIA